MSRWEEVEGDDEVEEVIRGEREGAMISTASLMRSGEGGLLEL